MRTATKIRATTTAWLPIDALRVDATTQRGVDDARAARMAEALDLNKLGIIVVSRRNDGSLYIIDGQHRVAALRIAGLGGEMIECQVYDGLTHEREAELFVGLNTFATVKAFDKFRVRLEARDEIAVGIDKILMEFGWRLGTGDSDGLFCAVVAAERVYMGTGVAEKDAGPENFRAALGTVTEAWGRKPINANGYIIHGLGLFYARYGADVDRPGLVKRLAQYPGGADNYLGKARGIREFRGGSLPRCVAELTTDLYNKKRGVTKLENWR